MDLSNNSMLLSTPKASQPSYSLEEETPAKNTMRVRNPFDQAMLDRLHLPLIGSPSLFQIPPRTPQMSSTLFEWTIEEVSSLKPVHLEAHETQFQDSPNPDLEAKAQSAISSYFKEQIIVPSPIDCPLRKNRIVLAELNGVTPITKNKNSYSHSRHSYSLRNAQTQTKLSLPPILPPELEKMLSDYMQPNFVQSGSSTPTSSSYGGDESQQSLKRNTLQIATEAAAKDISLRRKLFDKHNIILLDNNSSTNQFNQLSSSPTQNSLKQVNTIAGILSDSLDKSSICSLSPISATGGFSSPDELSSLRTKNSSIKRRAPDFLQKLQDIEDLSPISRPSPKLRRMSVESSKVQKSSFLYKYRGSPELSDLSAISQAGDGNEFLLSQTSMLQMADQQDMSLLKHVDGLKMAKQEEVEELSSSSNQSNDSDTPRCTKRGKSKNLSQSFSAFLEDEDDLDLAEEHNGNISQNLKLESVEQKLKLDKKKTESAMDGQKISYITGCDSGFNENCSRVKENYAANDDDVLMK